MKILESIVYVNSQLIFVGGREIARVGKILGVQNFTQTATIVVIHTDLNEYVIFRIFYSSTKFF